MTGAAPSLETRFAEAMGQLLGPDFPSDIALAVSGGGDSMAMLTLAHNWSHVWGVRLWVVTIDHGLRPEAAAEAAMVAEDCAALGQPHATLRWQWDGQGNLMDAARRARLRLIEDWRGDIRHVLMAHTRDDVAETVLMRLARGSGVEGLAAMQVRRHVQVAPLQGKVTGGRPPRSEAGNGGFVLCRPCLEMGRDELRHYLRTLRGRWVEDPTNDDETYSRVRIRHQIGELGLDVAGLAETAHRMSRARTALKARAAEVWDRIGTSREPANRTTGDILFDRTGFDAVERDTQMRLLSAALRYVATADYGPRAEPLEAMLDRLLGGGGAALHGCEARSEREAIRIFREFKALDGGTQSTTDSALWDGRWLIRMPGDADRTVRALGDAGWQQIAEKPEGAPPFHAARSLPSVWQGDRLVACDALGVGPGGTVRLWPMGQERAGFRQLLLSH